MANYPGTKLVGVAYKLRKKMKNSPSCVHNLHKPLNAVISRCCLAEDGKKKYQNVKRTCRAAVFAHQTYCFAALSLPSSLHKLPNKPVRRSVSQSVRRTDRQQVSQSDSESVKQTVTQTVSRSVKQILPNF